MTTTLKIIGSLTSPFVRITRIVCEELGLPYQLEETPPFARMTPEQNSALIENNPLMKVPVMVDGSQKIIDSRIIISYLLKKHKGGGDFRTNFPASADEDNIVTTLYGIMDAGVLRYIMHNSYPGIDMNSAYMGRSQERIGHGLDWLDGQQSLGKSFGVPEALLVCCLEWYKKREIYDWQPYKNLAALHKKFESRDSLVKTRIPENV